jgi:hypothetical protein
MAVGDQPSGGRCALRTFVVCGVFGVIAAEVVGLMLPGGSAASWILGAAVAAALGAARWRLGRAPRPGAVDAWADDSGASLSRWVERAESQIAWSDATRADWDRRLRPMLARQFELASRRARARNPVAFDATGRVHFGDELWAWVDPENVSRTGTREPGAGKAAFTAIIERLEQL